MKKIILIISMLLFFIAPAQKWEKNYREIMKSKNIYELDAFLKDAHEDDPRRDVLKPRLMELIEEYIKNAHPADQSLPTLRQKLALLQTRSSTKIDFEELKTEWKKQTIERYKQELAANERGEYKPYTPPKEEESDTPTIAQSIAEKNTEKPINIAEKINSGNKATSSKTFTRSGMYKKEEEEFNTLMTESSDEHKKKTVKILNALFDNDPNSKETTVLVENKSDCNIIVRIEGTNSYRLPVLSKTQNTIVVQKGDYTFSSIVCGGKYYSQKNVKGAIMVALNNPKK